jgi:hypothetical protein
MGHIPGYSPYRYSTHPQSEQWGIFNIYYCKHILFTLYILRTPHFNDYRILSKFEFVRYRYLKFFLMNTIGQDSCNYTVQFLYSTQCTHDTAGNTLFKSNLVYIMQCCGSGPGIRCFLYLDEFVPLLLRTRKKQGKSHLSLCFLFLFMIRDKKNVRIRDDHPGNTIITSIMQNRNKRRDGTHCSFFF